jgi:hypothetical protein
MKLFQFGDFCRAVFSGWKSVTEAVIEMPIAEAGRENFRHGLHQLTRICFVPKGQWQISQTHGVWQIVK